MKLVLITLLFVFSSSAFAVDAPQLYPQQKVMELCDGKILHINEDTGRIPGGNVYIRTSDHVQVAYISGGARMPIKYKFCNTDLCKSGRWLDQQQLCENLLNYN